MYSDPSQTTEKVGEKKKGSHLTDRLRKEIKWNHKKCSIKTTRGRDFLVVQWLRFHTPNAGCSGSTPSQGTRSHMPQLKTPCSQINFFLKPTNGRKRMKDIETKNRKQQI